MIVISNNSWIETKKIRELIDLLSKDYQKMDVELRIYGTVRSYIKDIFTFKKKSIGFLGLLTVMYHKVAGGYCDEYNFIDIYLFVGKTMTTEEFIDTLIHEMRHKYQSVYLPDLGKGRQYEFPCNEKIMKRYIENKKEQDAYDFSLEFYNLNKEKIDRIFLC